MSVQYCRGRDRHCEIYHGVAGSSYVCIVRFYTWAWVYVKWVIEVENKRKTKWVRERERVGDRWGKVRSLKKNIPRVITRLDIFGTIDLFVWLFGRYLLKWLFLTGVSGRDSVLSGVSNIELSEDVPSNWEQRGNKKKEQWESWKALCVAAKLSLHNRKTKVDTHCTWCWWEQPRCVECRQDL